MSRELEDLKAPIVELHAAIDGLSLVADSQGMKGGDTQVCLNFTANILREIHSNLGEGGMRRLWPPSRTMRPCRCMAYSVS